MVRASALTLLARGGSPTVKQPVIDAFLAIHQAPEQPQKLAQPDNEAAFASAIGTASAWILTPEDVQKLAAACGTPVCKRQIEAPANALTPPISILVVTTPINGVAQFSAGTVNLNDRHQLAVWVALFPKGTRFRLPRANSSWYQDLRDREIMDVLEAAGMQATFGVAGPPPK